MAQTPEGVSAKELERKLGVVYPTAWRMAKKIRVIRPSESEWGKPTFFDTFLQNCITENQVVKTQLQSSI